MTQILLNKKEKEILAELINAEMAQLEERKISGKQELPTKLKEYEKSLASFSEKINYAGCV